MKGLLEKQLAKDHFWEIDEDWLEMIGQKIVDMGNKKIVLLAKRNSVNIPELGDQNFSEDKNHDRTVSYGNMGKDIPIHLI